MSNPVHKLDVPLLLECVSENCQFRFPVLTQQEKIKAQSCPYCGSPTTIVETHANSPHPHPFNHTQKPLSIVEVLVDNIRSAYNIGSIFRISDGAGIQHVHLCGLSPTPNHASVVKTSLGAEKKVPWSSHRNGKNRVADLLSQGYTVWALETGEGSGSIFDLTYPDPSCRILLVIGNEVCGVDPGILRLCEKRLWIPMVGVKESLNVSSAFGIAAYTLCWNLRNNFASS